MINLKIYLRGVGVGVVVGVTVILSDELDTDGVGVFVLVTVGVGVLVLVTVGVTVLVIVGVTVCVGVTVEVVVGVGVKYWNPPEHSMIYSWKEDSQSKKYGVVFDSHSK